MKINKMFSVAALSLSAVLCLGFAGCKNLLNGGDLMNSLEEAIDYANAPSYTVRVQAAEGTGTITAGSGDNSLKVTDKLKVSFSKASGYKFLKWRSFLKSDGNVSSDDYVTFEDAAALETTATIVKGAEDIVIEPLCEKSLSITSAYPASSDEGVARDSSIKLVFSAPLSADNDLSRISISISGSTADGRTYFNDPVITENQLLFTAKTDNRINVNEGDTKTVTVTIPSDFTYVTDSGNLKIEDNLSYSYTINSTTAQKVTVIFGTDDENYGTMKVNNLAAASANPQYSIDEKVTISFKAANGYRFIKWQAVNPANTSVSLADYVTFEDETANETTLKFTSYTETMLIKPLCEPTLSVTGAYPASSDEGVARDSSIKLVFSAPLSAENDLSRISINVSGSATDGRTYFAAPQIVDNQLVITANTENRIYVNEGDTKTVTVTIPSDFTYVTDSGNLVIGEEISHSYVINSSTSDKTLITYGTNLESAGTMKVNGIVSTAVTQQYSIGQSVTVTFKVAEGYEFSEWEASDDGAIVITHPSVDDGYDENGFSSETSTATAYISIINSSENVTIKAITAKIPTADILVTSEHGKISPNGTTNYIKGKEAALIFNADSDYQFIEWRVIDLNTNSDITDSGYITFTDSKEFNTNFSLAKKLEDGISLSIQPLCQPRPQIISQTPLYTAAGVYRDTRIMVTFNQEMSEDSIYYNDEEVAALTADGNTLLYSTENDGTNKYYGYKNSSGEIFFKNIKITNFQTGANILENYDAPYFDSPQVLYIPTMPNEMNEDGSIKTAHAPAAGCQPYIEISKNVFYNDDDGNEIYLGSNKVWNYRVNSKIDNESPEFDLSTLKVSASTGFDGAENVTLTASSSSPSDLTAYKTAYLKDKKIKVFAEFSDQGSGPAGYVRVCYEKVLDSYYKTVTASTKESGYEKLEPVIDGTNAYVGTINGTSNIPETVDFSGRSDGLYKVWLECEDVNGYRGYSYTNENSADTYYYVLVDDENAAPYAIDSGIISGTRGSASQENLGWTSYTKTPDFDHFEIKCLLNENSTQFGDTQTSTDASVSFTGLTNQTKYKYEICAYDIFGNKTEYTSYVDNTAPAQCVSSCSSTRSSAANEALTWSYTTKSTDFSHVVVEQYISGKTSATDSFTAGSGIVTTKTFTGLTDQTKYSYRIYSVDYAGNKSSTYYSYTDNTAPAQCVSSLSGTRSSAANEALTWSYTTKSTDFSHVVVERYVSGNSSAAETFTATSGTVTTKTFTGLKDQTKYSYRIYSVDYAGNKSSTYCSYVDSTAPTAQSVKTFAKNGVHYLEVTHSNDNDWSKTEIYQGSTLKRTYYPSTVTDKKSSDTYSVNTGTASTYTIRTYDFASNYSDSVITEKFTPGAIYYNDNNLTSSNYYSDMTPIGVLMYTGDKSNNKSPRIWGLDEVSGYCWGSKGDKVGNCSATTNGLSNYTEMSTGTNKGSVLNLNKLWGTDDTTNGNCYSFTHYLYYDRNTNDNLTGKGVVTWYAPACDELSTYLQPNIDAVKATFTLLTNKGVSCTFDETHWIWSSTEWNSEYAKQIASYKTGYSWNFSKNRHKVAHGDDGTTETYCHFMAQVDNLY